MFSLKLTRWLLGFARFSVRGGSPERFYTSCARAGIYLWDISAGKTISVCVAARSYRALRPLARRAGCRLKVLEKQGLPFLLYRTRGHMGLWAGGAAFLAIVFVLSLRVWCVQVTGECPYPTAEVENALASEGLSRGVWKSSVDPRVLASRMMLKFPDIRWMSINMHGCEAEIAVRKKIQKPEIADFSGVCNIKASATGQIRSMKVYAGTPVVQKGDAVVKDQLLVNAVVEDQLGGNTLVHASAEIIAETSRDLTVHVDLKQPKTVPTGKTVFRRNLNLFGAQIPLSLLGKPVGSWNVTRSESSVALFGTVLPLSVYEEKWEQTHVAETVLTKSQALTAAKQEADRQIRQLLGSGKVISEKSEEKWESGALVKTIHLTCEENIAQESAIFIKAG